jgi:hypothetical protein
MLLGRSNLTPMGAPPYTVAGFDLDHTGKCVHPVGHTAIAAATRHVAMCGFPVIAAFCLYT